MSEENPKPINVTIEECASRVIEIARMLESKGFKSTVQDLFIISGDLFVAAKKIESYLFVPEKN